MIEPRRPARQGDQGNWNVDMRHVPCGCRVSAGYGLSYSCSAPACKVAWKSEVMAKFTDAEMAERFYVVTPADLDTYVLVARLDSFTNRTHTVLVKQSELRETDKKVPV